MSATLAVSPAARRSPPSSAVLGLAFAGYLALSVLLWWHAWSAHPTSVTTCGCDDPATFLWFLEWPAYAIAHGHDPFYSTALFHPAGINLLANTGVLAIGVPLAPVTWLFGPVATLNVASTLVPALTALSMCWLLLRWVRWPPAALVGGLAFGFSPYMITNLAVAHLNVGTLALLPPMVACLDDLLVRRRHRPLRTGAVLGVLAVVQFFLSTEILAVAVVLGAVAVVLVAAYAAVAHRDELVARAPHALRGLAAAGVVAVVLLAYPVWVALAGPAHLSGLVWPTIAPGAGGVDLHALWSISFSSRTWIRYLAGYQGPALPTPSYLGLGALAVLAAGVVAWRRDRRLWCFGAVGVVALALAVGLRPYWTPWRILAHVPVVQNVLPGRLMTVVTLCAAVMTGVVVDRTYASSLAWARRVTASRVTARRPCRHAASPPGAVSRRAPGGPRAGLLVAGAGTVALAVAAVALVPMATASGDNVPLTTEAVTLPPWFSQVAPGLRSGQVVLTYPPPAVGGYSVAWQAVDGLTFAMATGTGPESVPRRAGRERAGQALLTAAAELFPTLAPATPTNVDAVRRAVAGWGVTRVVVPDPSVLVPRLDRAAGTAWALGLFTLALGRPPVVRDGAWVWSDVRSPGRRRSIAPSTFTGCTAPARYRSPPSRAVPDCVMAASRPVP